MIRPTVPYRYPSSHYAEALFADASNYPALHLPVANFIEEAADPPRPVYEGASDLANFVLWRAIDENPAVRELTAQRQLWLTANFRLPKGDINVDLQVHQEYLSLRAGDNATTPRANWLLRTRDGKPTYEITFLNEENSMLFAFYGQEKSLPVSPQTYDHTPTNVEYLRDPALGYAYRFWCLETSLTYAALVQPSAFEQYISVRPAASR